MIELIPHNTRFDFVGFRKKALVISLALTAVSALLMITKGPKMGIDFAGGSLVQVRLATPTHADKLRESLAGAGFEAVDIQDVGRDQKDFLIRVPMAADDTESRTQKVATTLKNSFGADQVDVLRVEAVGPRVGQALRGRAIWAVLASTLMMGIYIWARFEDNQIMPVKN